MSCAGLILLFALVLLAASTAATWRSGDPSLYPAPTADEGVTIFVVSNGYHTGLAVSRAAVIGLARADTGYALHVVSERFVGYPWLLFGWGEEKFYMARSPEPAAQIRLALRALLWPSNDSVLHVHGLLSDPVKTFAPPQIVMLRLSDSGSRSLVDSIAATFSTTMGIPKDLGPGLHPGSLFYRANGRFSILSVCNHWTDSMLAAAGLPGSPVLATTAPTLLWALRRAAARQQVGLVEPVSHWGRRRSRSEP